MINVTSSNIKGYEYNENSFELLVYFLNESVYSYQSVSKEVVDEFVLAESKGKYFNSMIKNKYASNKVKDAIKKPNQKI